MQPVGNLYLQFLVKGPTLITSDWSTPVTRINLRFLHIVQWWNLPSKRVGIWKHKNSLPEPPLLGRAAILPTNSVWLPQRHCVCTSRRPVPWLLMQTTPWVARDLECKWIQLEKYIWHQRHPWWLLKCWQIVSFPSDGFVRLLCECRLVMPPLKSTMYTPTRQLVCMCCNLDRKMSWYYSESKYPYV